MSAKNSPKLFKKRMNDIDVKTILKKQEAILRELIRATRDVLMLRYAKIRRELVMKPTIYDQIGKGKWHNQIVEKMGGEMITSKRLIIQTYYRTKETKETSTVFDDEISEWLPASYWKANPVLKDDKKKYM